MIKTNNRWIVILAHTLLAIVMMQACRLLFYFFNKGFFKEISADQLFNLMQGGYTLDMVVIGYGFLLYYVLRLVGGLLPLKVELAEYALTTYYSSN